MFFLPNLRNIDVALPLRLWSLLILWRDIFETLVFSLAIFLIFIVFVLLNSESLMFHCCFIDDSLMILWRTINDSTTICMQTLKIIEVFNVIFIRTLVFLCCLIDQSLMILWRVSDNIRISDDFDANNNDNKFFCANLENIDNSLPLTFWFCDDDLERLC